MSGVTSSAASSAGRPEQLIGALIPPTIHRSTPPVPLVIPPLPSPGPMADDLVEPLVVDMACLDASGRFCSRLLLRTLRWPPGHRVGLRVCADAVVIDADPAGRQSVGRRGELTLPATARALAGLDADSRVALVAVPARDRLMVHPPSMVARLMAEHYHRQEPGDGHGG